MLRAKAASLSTMGVASCWTMATTLPGAGRMPSSPSRLRKRATLLRLTFPAPLGVGFGDVEHHLVVEPGSGRLLGRRARFDPAIALDHRKDAVPADAPTASARAATLSRAGSCTVGSCVSSSIGSVADRRDDSRGPVSRRCHCLGGARPLRDVSGILLVVRTARPGALVLIWTLTPSAGTPTPPVPYQI